MNLIRTKVVGINLTAEPILTEDAPNTATGLITQSRLECFNLCRRKHKHRYIDGYAEATEKQELAWGKAWHKFQEYWWVGRRSWGELTERCFDPVREILDPLAMLQLEELARGYDFAWADRAKEYEVEWLEREFRAPLYDPSITTGGGTRPIELSAAFLLGGKMDGLLRRVSDGRFFLKENKSTSEKIESDAEPYWDKLVMDHQLSLYMIGSDALGYDVEDALYDVVRKPSIRPDGRKGETMDDYRARLAGEIKRNPASYFRWREVPRQTRELFHAYRDFWDAARLMEIEDEGRLSPRNPAACYKYGFGKPCAFVDVCLGNTTLDSDPKIVRMPPFQELESMTGGA